MSYLTAGSIQTPLAGGFGRARRGFGSGFGSGFGFEPGRSRRHRPREPLADGCEEDRHRHIRPAQETGTPAQHIERIAINIKQTILHIPSRHASQIAAELNCDAVALEAELTKAITAEMNGICAPVVPPPD